MLRSRASRQEIGLLPILGLLLAMVVEAVPTLNHPDFLWSSVLIFFTMLVVQMIAIVLRKGQLRKDLWV
jgi:hypothetical protein